MICEKIPFSLEDARIIKSSFWITQTFIDLWTSTSYEKVGKYCLVNASMNHGPEYPTC